MGGQQSKTVGSGTVKATRIFSGDQPESIFDQLIERMDEIVDTCQGEMLQLNGCMNKTKDKNQCAAHMRAYRECHLRRDATMVLLDKMCGTEKELYEGCMRQGGAHPTDCVEVLQRFLDCSEHAVSEQSRADSRR